MLLLDTDVMIDILRNHHPATEWLRQLGEEEIALPGAETAIGQNISLVTFNEKHYRVIPDLDLLQPYQRA